MAPVHHNADDDGRVHIGDDANNSGGDVCGCFHVGDDGDNSGGDDDGAVHGGDGYGGFTICCLFDCGDPEWCGNISDGF